MLEKRRKHPVKEPSCPIQEAMRFTTRSLMKSEKYHENNSAKTKNRETKKGKDKKSKQRSYSKLHWEPLDSMKNSSMQKYPLLNSPEKKPDSNKHRGILSSEQTEKLTKIMNDPYEIMTKDETISIQLTPSQLLNQLRIQCERKRILEKDAIRLCGSGAAHILSNDSGIPFNDLDFTFYCTDSQHFAEILGIEEDVVAHFVEEQCDIQLMPKQVFDLFFLDSILIQNNHFENKKDCESWSLISLGKKGQKTIDIRFVYNSKRSYAFSIDSFEIIVDPIFDWTKEKKQYFVESLYGDLEKAISHLNSGTLCTVHPEQIRRGIFRYCHEIAKGRLPQEKKQAELEKVFVETFLQSESISQFEDVLSKFLLRHPSTSQKFLTEMKRLISTDPEADPFLQIINKYNMIQTM